MVPTKKNLPRFLYFSARFSYLKTILKLSNGTNLKDEISKTCQQTSIFFLQHVHHHYIALCRTFTRINFDNSKQKSLLCELLSEIKENRQCLHLTNTSKFHKLCYTFLSFCCFLGGSHLKHDASTVRTGGLYCELLRCSSTSFGVTQITCCPFQYFTMFNDCNVLMMSF